MKPMKSRGYMRESLEFRPPEARRCLRDFRSKKYTTLLRWFAV